MKSSGEHRRGRSMGSTASRVGEKDEELALFHDMRRHEKRNFLHPSPDDLDATLSSKFGGMGAPIKKPGTDLLNSESDKNDYDWLLTPPGTPLFPSLDQEAAALAVLSPALSNGSFSSASSASRSMKSAYSPAESLVSKGSSSRGNPSPRRPTSAGNTPPNGISRSRSSPSAAILTRPSTPTSSSTGIRPSTPTTKSLTSASSAPAAAMRASTPNLKLTLSQSSKSSPTPAATRPSTPTPRSSTPPVRPSTPGARSSTPTSKPSTPTMKRSLSGGRTGAAPQLQPSPSVSTTRGGPSPKRTTSSSSSRGSSPSAKRASASVITSVAGMSSETPPNLRTTAMPDRPSSAGKTHPSSNGGGGGTAENDGGRRRPRSPSVARSFSSSSSLDQRATSSQTSRGSVVSSFDDGFEVNRPSSIGGGNRNSSSSSVGAGAGAGGKWHTAGHEELLGGKANAFAKRVARPSSIGSRDTGGGGGVYSSGGYNGGTPSKKSAAEPVKRQDAYQNSPTTAYRHLHSHSPVSPFYGSRANGMHLRPRSAMNSSVTTSSNASSEHGTTVAADTEGSERDEDDLLSWDSYGRRASTSPRMQADILVLDKDDEKTGPWNESVYERAHSREPSSSHSQGSQSTNDAEVNGFYETDGIASLEMLEQLGLMGENYKLKKSSTFGGRSADLRSSSLDDSKITSLRTDESGHQKLAHRFFQEGQGARNGAKLEGQDSLERLRRSRDVEAELLKRNGEKSPVSLDPKLPNSEIRAACLFVRDFKVGLAPPNSQAPPSMKNSSPGSSIHEIDEIEMKLRSELSYDWDNTVELNDPPTMDAKEETASFEIKSQLSDSPILVSHRSIGSLEPAALSLEHPGISAPAVYDADSIDSVGSPVLSNHMGRMELGNPEAALLPTDVDLKHPISMKGTPASAMIDGSCDHNGMMDERDTESSLPMNIDVDSSIPVECARSNAMPDSTIFEKKVTSPDRPVLATQKREIQSGLSDHGICEVGEGQAEVPVPENAAVVDGSDKGSGKVEGSDGGGCVPVKELEEIPLDVDVVHASKGENYGQNASGDIQLTEPDNQPEVADDVFYEIPSQVVENEEENEDDGLHGIRLSDAENEEEVVDEEPDGMKSSETQNEQEVVDEGLDLRNSTEKGNEEDVADDGNQVMALWERDYGQDILEEGPVHGRNGHDIVPVNREGGPWQESEQGILHSNGNQRLADPEYASIQESQARRRHEMQLDTGNVADAKQTQQEQLGLSEYQGGGDVKESYDCLDEKEANQEQKLPRKFEAMGTDNSDITSKSLKDELISGSTWEEGQELEVLPCETAVNLGSVGKAGHGFSNRQIQEEGDSLEYVDVDSAATVEDAGEEISSGLKNIQVQEESCSLKDCNTDSVKKYADLEVAPQENGNVLQFPSLASKSVYEASNEDSNVVQDKLPEIACWSPDNQGMLNALDQDYEVLPNCKARSSVDGVDHTEAFAQVPSEDKSQLQLQKPGFRSASHLCATLEEQIAGLIQKIDSAIEESSKPYNSGPQEAVVVKDKRSSAVSSELSRDPEQEDCAASIRSSQEEDLLDSLWAEEDDSSWSEGSRDQDMSTGKDSSQREINVVRSSRLSDRGLPASPLGSSLNDPGLEKHQVEEFSKKGSVGVAAQEDDVVHRFTGDPEGGPPLRSSSAMAIQSSVVGYDPVPEDANLQLSTQPETGRLSVEGDPNVPGGNGGQSKIVEDLCIESYGEQDAGAHLSEPENDMNTDEELVSACASGQGGLDDGGVVNSAGVESSWSADAGPVGDKLAHGMTSSADKIHEEKATIPHESAQEGGESSEAEVRYLSGNDVAFRNISPPLLGISSTTWNSHRETVEVRDSVPEKMTNNKNRGESSILLTLSHPDVSSGGARNEEWLHRTSKRQGQPMRPTSSLGHVAKKDISDSQVHEEQLQILEQQKVLREVCDRQSHSLMPETLDFRNEGEAHRIDEAEAQGNGSIWFEDNSLLSDSGVKSVQEALDEGTNMVQEEETRPDRASLGHHTTDTGAEQELETVSTKEIEDRTNQRSDTCVVPNSVAVEESTRLLQRDLPQELPERLILGHSDLNRGTEANALVEEGDFLFMLAEETWSVSPNRVSPSQEEKVLSVSALQENTHDFENHTQPKEAQCVQENSELQQHPGSFQEGMLNQRQKDSDAGQHIKLITGNKMSIPDSESPRMEEHEHDSRSDAGELGRPPSFLPTDTVPTTTGREKGSEEAHRDSAEVVDEQKHYKQEDPMEGPGAEIPEVTRLSVWSETPVMDFTSTRRPTQGNELSSGLNGNRDFGTQHEEANGLDSQFVKRLPLNKAKSVRTISLSPIMAQSASHPQEDGLVDEEVQTPQKSTAFANITVLSPEKVQWDHSPSADDTTSKRSSPASLSRNMTLAEATDTILYCSSLVHTIVYKAAAYAMEKEDLAALASTPTSNGEALHYTGLSEVDHRDQDDHEGGETENLKGVSTGPASARRALSYMGHETLPATPADTSLQIPVDQMIEKPESPEETPIAVHQKNESEVPVKVAKSRCGCSIM